MRRLNKYKLLLVIVGLLLIGVALYFAYKRWGDWALLGILGTLMGGLGTVAQMTPINRDEGRAVRPDMGGRGTVTVTEKTPEGETVTTEKRTRPRRGGRGMR